MLPGVNLKALYEDNPKVIGENLYGSVIEQSPVDSAWLCCINSEWNTEDCKDAYIGNAAKIVSDMNKSGKKDEPYVIKYDYLTNRTDTGRPGTTGHGGVYTVKEVDMGKVFYVMKGVEVGRVFGKFSKVYDRDLFGLSSLASSIARAEVGDVSKCLGNINDFKANYYIGCDTFANELLVNTILTDKMKDKNLDDLILQIRYYSMCNKWGIVATDYHPLLDLGYILKNKQRGEFLMGMRVFDFDAKALERDYYKRLVDSFYKENALEQINTSSGILPQKRIGLDNGLATSIVLQILIFLYVAHKNLNFSHGDLTVENVILAKEPFKKYFEVGELDELPVTIESNYKVKLTGFKYSSLTFKNREKVVGKVTQPIMDFRENPSAPSTAPAPSRPVPPRSIETVEAKVRIFNLYKFNYLDNEYFKSAKFDPETSEKICVDVGGKRYCSGTTWWNQGKGLWWAPGKNLMYITQHTGLPYHRAYDFYTFILSLALSENGYATIFSNMELTAIWGVMWLPDDYKKMTQLVFRKRDSDNPENGKIANISKHLSEVHMNCSIIVTALEIMTGRSKYQRKIDPNY